MCHVSYYSHLLNSTAYTTLWKAVHNYQNNNQYTHVCTHCCSARQLTTCHVHNAKFTTLWVYVSIVSTQLDVSTGFEQQNRCTNMAGTVRLEKLFPFCYAPINVMPHPPCTGIGGDLTHRMCQIPHPSITIQCQIPTLYIRTRICAGTTVCV